MGWTGQIGPSHQTDESVSDGATPNLSRIVSRLVLGFCAYKEEGQGGSLPPLPLMLLPTAEEARRTKKKEKKKREVRVSRSGHLCRLFSRGNNLRTFDVIVD